MEILATLTKINFHFIIDIEDKNELHILSEFLYFPQLQLLKHYIQSFDYTQFINKSASRFITQSVLFYYCKSQLIASSKIKTILPVLY